ncbi:hypothetical protein [Pararhizobium sp. DWP1-1-3]|uniref:hypothetical protein n=1 Tax=Pararhizobium sp. DWP1-1-3 TaxID=2804652 RepID=UPI003CEE75F3
MRADKVSEPHGIQEEPPVPANEEIPSEELAYRLRQQRLAADFGYYALKSVNLRELLQEATRATADGLNVKFAEVLEHRVDTKGFLAVAGVGWREGLIGVAIVGDDLESPAGYAYHTGQSVFQTISKTNGVSGRLKC